MLAGPITRRVALVALGALAFLPSRKERAALKPA